MRVSGRKGRSCEKKIESYVKKRKEGRDRVDRYVRGRKVGECEWRERKLLVI